MIIQSRKKNLLDSHTDAFLIERNLDVYSGVNPSTSVKLCLATDKNTFAILFIIYESKTVI